MQWKIMNQKKNAETHNPLAEMYLYQQKFEELQNLFLCQDHQSHLLKMRKKKYYYRLHPNQNRMIQMEQEILGRKEEWNGQGCIEGYHLVEWGVENEGQHQQQGQEVY